MQRLAIVTSHPVQYYAPWFRHLAAHSGWEIRVFYLWDHGIRESRDREFGRSVRWDTDLLSGYGSEFVPNVARHPGTHAFGGLRNPELIPRLAAFAPHAVMVLGYGWASLLWLALRWKDCPLILRGDSNDIGLESLSFWRRKARSLALRCLFRQFAAFAAVGAANRRHYLAHGVAPERISHVPHCIDQSAFAAKTETRADALKWRESLGIPSGNLVIGFAGKFIPKKRPDLLVRAFTRANLANVSLVLVGGGKLQPQLEQLAAGAPDVVLAPFENQSAMPRVLAAFDLLVLPSEGRGETWGLVVNEAMAAGVPCVVSTDVGCREDLVVEGVTGWSFPAGDEAALAGALRQAAAKIRAGAPELGVAVRERIAAYSYDSATAALTRLLNNLPAKPR